MEAGKGEDGSALVHKRLFNQNITDSQLGLTGSAYFQYQLITDTEELVYFGGDPFLLCTRG